MFKKDIFYTLQIDNDLILHGYKNQLKKDILYYLNSENDIIRKLQSELKVREIIHANRVKQLNAALIEIELDEKEIN